ncbi:antibiotic biosynthesis monooxygenase family protein [Sphingobacterium daejeonense]|uniref:antibiotic biosynthesis monooxygenase family protein n=1 Tax=Sphingobacterium daejeonense TaxID=371142 RepID=UPI0010C2C8DA|nr:antibiotic biosynthesis monooxygenase [Sphingobacterium daejeonense]VTP91653.1 Antibiotic biosynthesis monooxygenase [Sphingobacterium daejeonense]
MIAVIFEVYPNDGKLDEYLDIAKMLRPELDHIEGFISIERFQSLINPDKILSLSFWKDEKSVMKWRNQVMHRGAQKAGRETVFKDYRLRVASVLRDYGMDEREQAPEDTPF